MSCLYDAYEVDKLVPKKDTYFYVDAPFWTEWNK